MKKTTPKNSFSLNSLFSMKRASLCFVLFSFFIFSFSFSNAQTTQSFSYTGTVQTWAVPAGVTSATITATGASGGIGLGIPGVGAVIEGVCSLTPGDNISVVVGQFPGRSRGQMSAGGGGSFVWDASSTTLLIVAGGGGGCGGGPSQPGNGGIDVTFPWSPTDDSPIMNAPGGSGGSGGSAAAIINSGGGGGGWLSNGGTSIAPNSGMGGRDMQSGFAGGAGFFVFGQIGGYGGGGGTGGNNPYGGGGGGGGYNGGGGGNGASGPSSGAGGGGGSYLNGTLISATATNFGANGTVTITYTTGPVCSVTEGAPTLNSNVTCNGNNNGSATAATPSGGVSPYTYQWNSGATSTNAINSTLTADTYTVYVTDANGCTATSTGTVTISQPNLLTEGAPTWNNDVTCNGNNNGSGTAATPSGGTAPYTYQWNSGVTSTNITNSSLTADTYTVYVQDANGCTATSSGTVIIGQPNLLTEAAPTLNSNVTCNGNNNGSATAATPSGGTAPYTYQWNNGSSNTNPTNSTLSAGTYSVDVTDANGCTATSSGTVTITQPGQLLFVTSTTPSSSTVNFSYLSSLQTWTVPAGIAQVSVNASGAAGGNAGAAGGDGAVITGALVSVTQGHTINVITGGAGAGNFGASGGGASYVWDASSTAVPLVVAGGGGGAGYQGTNDAGMPASITTSANNYSSTYDNTTQVNTFGGGGGTSPNYGGGGGGGGYNGNGANGATGVYHTGGGGGISALSGGAGGTAGDDGRTGGFGGGGGGGLSGGGGGGYNGGGGGNENYSAYSAGGGGGGSAVNGANPASCAATNAGNGSVAITYTTYPVTSSATILSNVTCNNGANGSISAPAIVGGTTPYTYTWTPSGGNSSTASNLSAATYTITVQDNCGATATATATITQPTVLTETVTSETEVRCNGASTGAATVSGWGGSTPYSYSWNGGPFSTTNATLSGLSAGTYTVTVSDANGCTATHTLTLKQPSPLRDSIVTSKTLNIKCLGVNYGTAQMGAKYGTTPYTYLWSNSLTNAEVTTLSAGTYTINVTDNCGASGSTTVTITAPAAALSQTTTVNKNVTCFGGNDGGATANPSGGTIPYTYLWNTGETNQTITDFIAGNHQSTLKDAHGCSVITPTIITQPAVISASFTTTKSCFGGSTGTATATGKGGSGNYTSYIWSNSDAGSSISALSAGTYAVTITDNNSCTGTASVTVAPYTQLVTTIPLVTCIGVGGQGKLTVSSTGGTPAYAYHWSTGATTTTITVVNGSYVVNCKDKNSCTTSATASFNACPEIKPKNDDGDNDGTSVENNVSVYPNPNSGEFTIAGLENGMIVEMYDYTGRKITAVSASDKTMQLNIANQPNGIYLIRILNKDGNLVGQKKVVKTN